MLFSEWVERWERVMEEQKRSAEYEAKYQAALRRFNSGVISVNGRKVGESEPPVR